MLAKFGRIFVAVAVLLVGFAQLYTWWTTKQANTAITDGGKHIAEGDKLADAALEKYRLLVSDENQKAFPGNRKDLESLVNETAELYRKSSEEYRLAKTKYEEALKDHIDDEHVTAYWKLRAELFEKLALVNDAHRSVSLLVLDPTIDDWDKLDTRAASFVAQSKAANEAAKKLAADAQKIHDDYPNSFAKE